MALVTDGSSVIAPARRRRRRASGSTRPLSRRHLLRHAAFGVGALPLGGAFLAACASDGSEPDPAGQSGQDVTGGTLAAAIAVSFPSLDTVVASFPGGLVASWFWGERLFRLDPFPPRQELLPELAVELPRMITPTTYEVTLREGTTFHNGRPFTAEDVVFTFQKILDPETGALQLSALDFITGIEAIGDYEIGLTLKTPTTLLASRLALVTIHPADATEANFDLAPVGTGPYRVASAVSNEEIVLERFDDYAGTRDIRYDRIELHFVEDANARLTGLRTEQFDIVEDVPVGAFQELESGNDVTAEAVPSYGWTPIMFNCGKPPFDDPLVRRAVMYSIDRDAINQTSLFGLAEPAWAGFVPPSHPDFTEPGLVYSFDPDRARELLADAGLAGRPIPVDILVPTDTEYVNSQAPMIEQNLRDVGFEPHIVPSTSAAIWTPISEGDFNAALTAAADWSADSTELDFLARGSFAGFVAAGLNHWTGPDADAIAKLLADALAAPDEDARRPLLVELQETIQQKVPSGALFLMPKITAWSNDLQGYEPHSTFGIAPLDGVHG